MCTCTIATGQDEQCQLSQINPALSHFVFVFCLFFAAFKQNVKSTELDKCLQCLHSVVSMPFSGFHHGDIHQPLYILIPVCVIYIAENKNITMSVFFPNIARPYLDFSEKRCD